MKEITFTLTFLMFAIGGLLAQRGGNVYCHDNHQGHHVNQQQFNSITSLNRGNGSNGLRPNTNIGHDHHGHDANAGHNYYYGHLPVQNSTFTSWLHTLSHERNSAVRMDIALDYVGHNWLTTHQIHDILDLFDNQSIMLRIAELAYANTCDPQNYHQLYSCFSNSACVLHLQEFVVGR